MTSSAATSRGEACSVARQLVVYRNRQKQRTLNGSTRKWPAKANIGRSDVDPTSTELFYSGIQGPAKPDRLPLLGKTSDHSKGGEKTHRCCVTPLLRSNGCEISLVV